MVKIKNTLLLIVTIILGILLTSCDYSYYIYYNSDGTDLFVDKDVMSIELIQYENKDTRSNPLGNEDFDSNKIEVLEILQTDHIENFVLELSQIGGISGKHEEKINSPLGIGIRIIYEDQSFTITTITIIDGVETIFMGDYDQNEEIGIYLGISWQDMIDDFKMILSKYFDMSIDSLIWYSVCSNIIEHSFFT